MAAADMPAYLDCPPCTRQLPVALCVPPTQVQLMHARKPLPPDDDDDRQTASLSGLVVALLLVVAGLLLVRALHLEAALEDCLLAGRLVCEGGLPP